jgi:hypothetical protein
MRTLFVAESGLDSTLEPHTKMLAEVEPLNRNQTRRFVKDVLASAHSEAI